MKIMMLMFCSCHITLTLFWIFKLYWWCKQKPRLTPTELLPDELRNLPEINIIYNMVEDARKSCIEIKKKAISLIIRWCIINALVALMFWWASTVF